MSQHDVHRAKARRAQSVAAARSQKKASIKRAMTMGMKTAAVGAAMTAGTYYLSTRSNPKLNSIDLNKASDFVRTGKKIFMYI